MGQRRRTAGRTVLSLAATFLGATSFSSAWAACGPATNTVAAGTYSTPQSFNQNASATVIVSSGTTINTTNGSPAGNEGDGVHITPNQPSGPFAAANGSNCLETQGTVDINVGTSATDRDGIRVLSSAPGNGTAGSAEIYTSEGTTVNVWDEYGDGLIARSSNQGDASANGRGAGNVTVISKGVINTHGNSASGITARSGGTATSVTVSGDITVSAPNTGTSSAGLINSSAGIFAQNRNASGAGSTSVVLEGGAKVTTLGLRSIGISAGTEVNGTVDVDTEDGEVSTNGDFSTAIQAQSASGAVIVKAGKASTTGKESNGITASSGSNGGVFGYQPTISLSPFIYVPAPAPVGTGGAVSVTATDSLSALGEQSAGILASSNNSAVNVFVEGGASVMGGWEDVIGKTGTYTGLAAAGIVMGSGGGTASTLTNAGQVGALSDRAIASSELYQEHFTAMTLFSLANGAPGAGTSYSDAGAANVINNTGLITGFVELGTGSNRLVNDGVIAQRNFSDTDGNLLRDTERVAKSTFGGTAQVTNNGTFRLDTVIANTIDASANPQYVPQALTGGYLPSFYDINRASVEQGHLLGVERFVANGTITMQDLQTSGNAAVAGDLFYISQANTANGAAGGGSYIANRGSSLWLDTILNQGSAASSRSDVLVVDGTELGTGPTYLHVAKAGGTSASTDLNGNGLVDEGEGILVVEVLDSSRSAANVFRLAGNRVLNTRIGNHTYSNEGVILDGPYLYRLVGPTDYDVAAARSSGDWYLVNQLSPATTVYGWSPRQDDVGTLLDRTTPRMQRAPEEVFCKDASQQFRCKLTPEQEAVYAEDQGKDGLFMRKHGLWLRSKGNVSHEASDGFAVTEAESWGWSIAGGLDGEVLETARGDSLFAGLSAQYGRDTTDLSSSMGGGKIEASGIGLGASLTWYDHSGFYADAQAGVAWNSRDLSSDALGSLIEDNRGRSGYLSLEVGRPVALSSGWNLTPQVQLSYLVNHYDDFTDNLGSEVHPGTSETLRGRTGLALERSAAWTDDDGLGRSLSLHASGDVLYDLMQRSSASYAGIDLASSAPDALWGRIGLGGRYAWDNDHFSVDGEVGASGSLDNPADNHSFSGTAGFTVKW
ncbi:MAG: autotransporter outer membrane beta-barrel domain-containing protein [Proteobacteria bacterium]|nr:autotransporter outer membrane beta-barrel domain-containing protein [Pseudomonadota bacterium]